MNTNEEMKMYPRRKFLFSFVFLLVLFLSVFRSQNIERTLGANPSNLSNLNLETIASGITSIISISTGGDQGNNPSYNSHHASTSSDGRYVVFTSDASTLVSNDTNGFRDAFVHDRQTGITSRISIASNGTQGNGPSGYIGSGAPIGPSISDDGRYVVFESGASNLVSGDTNGVADIFLRDLQLGTTIRVSVASNGSQADAFSSELAISPNGQFIAFMSVATNLVANDNPGSPDVFVYDRITGQTTRVSVASDGTPGNSGSGLPSFSSDGRFVAFLSYANNLVPGDTNNVPDIFVHDRQTGQTTRVSVASNGSQSNGDSRAPMISGNGEWIVFESDASNLVSGDTNSVPDVFIHNRVTGQTLRSSIASDGSQGNDLSNVPSVSYDGKFVAFQSPASTLVSGDTNNSWDVFVHDQTTGETFRASVDSLGVQGNSFSWNTSISSTGRFVTFSSFASNLQLGDTNGTWDVFIRDLVELSISHVEITQAIQDINNNVPLIQGKPTFIRVYVDCGVGCISQQNISGVLQVISPAGTMSLQPINGLITAYHPNSWTNLRAELNKTLNFIVPQNLLTGNVSFTAIAGGAAQTISRTFDNVDPLRIGFVSINYQGQLPDVNRIAGGFHYLDTVYPVTEVDYFPIPYFFPYLGGKNAINLLNYLQNIFTFFEIFGWPSPNGEPNRLFGWVPNSTWGLDGAAYIGGLTAYGSDTPANKVYQVIMAHELGHTYGRKHPICDDPDPFWPFPDYAIHDIGYDFGFYSTSLVPETTDDLMIGGHCGANELANKWISAYTFTQLHSVLSNQSQQDSLQLGQEIELIEADQAILLVNGRIFTDTSAELGKSYQLTTTQIITKNIGTDYCLTLEDITGVPLTSSCFDVSFTDPEWGTPVSKVPFIHLLAYDANAARLVLTQGSNVLAERLISTNVPTVTLLTPNGGETLNGTVEITWTADDIDGDSLEFVVSYSADGGQSWFHPAIGITETHILIDTDNLPGSEQAMFRVTATDGMNTSYDSSDNFFSVISHPPQANILSPNDGVTKPLQLLFLHGYAYDTEDGILDEASFIWSSDLDGNLGTGSSILANLSKGQHQITLNVTDSDGNVSAATITVNIGFKIYLPIAIR